MTAAASMIRMEPFMTTAANDLPAYSPNGRVSRAPHEQDREAPLAVHGGGSNRLLCDSLSMFNRTEFVDSSVSCRGFQVSLAKGLPHVVQFVGIINTEIWRPTGLVFHQGNLYLSNVLSFMYVLGLLSMPHRDRLRVNV